MFMKHVARLCRHKGAQTFICPSQSPSHSFETARPMGRVSALGEGFGIPNRSPDPPYIEAEQEHVSPAQLHHTRVVRNSSLAVLRGKLCCFLSKIFVIYFSEPVFFQSRGGNVMAHGGQWNRWTICPRHPRSAVPCHVCVLSVFITAGPIINLCSGGGAGEQCQYVLGEGHVHEVRRAGVKGQKGVSTVNV